MASTRLPSTVMDFVDHSSPAASVLGGSQKKPWLSSVLPASSANASGVEGAGSRGTSIGVVEGGEYGSSTRLREILEDDDPELKLPDRRSLFVVILGNALFQFSLFVIVSSASAYTAYLGGSATFSGLIIGTPPAFSGVALIFMVNYDGGQYKRPFNIAYAAMLVGNIMHALAYKAHFLYLLLIGRIVVGIGFTSFMFTKRYCSDPRFVGVRRRTMLASWLVVGQAFGFSAGPFLGGLLYKVGFRSEVFNGYTSPGWVMAGVWGLFWVASQVLFKDVPPKSAGIASRVHGDEIALEVMPASANTVEEAPVPVNEDITLRSLTARQWGVILCMCYYSFTCFLILGGWESNIPIFTAFTLNYSPYQAGNFIALGGISTFPFLLLNVRYARRIQDRITLAVGSFLGLLGLLLMLALLKTGKVAFGPLYVCWFLIALGFNLASTCTLSLLSKQLPDGWNSRVSMAIQYSNYAGRVTGAIMGGAGVKMGMVNYVGVQIAVVGIGGVMHMTLWREMKAKTG